MGDARISWEAELQGRIAAAVQEAVQKAEADTRTQLEQTNEARLAEVLERRLGEARASWEMELQGCVAAAVQEAVQTTESETRALLEETHQIHLAQELDRQLSAARTSWEAELQGRLATAVQDAVQEAVQGTRSESATQLEQARQEWRDVSARDLAEMSARYMQADAALEELRKRPPLAKDAEDALRALRDELTMAQTSIRARESELAEARQDFDRAAAELSQRKTETDATLEQNWAAWSAERQDLLAQAEENTQQRVKQAIEQNRNAWQTEREQIIARAEASAQDRLRLAIEEWEHESHATLSRAKQEWADGEATRLAVAQAKWRENIGLVKSRGAIVEVTKRRRGARVSRRFIRLGAVAACLAAAVMLYPRAKPVVVENWWPKIVAYKADIEPSLRKAATEILSRLTELVNGPEAIAIITVPVAKVRAGPSQSAAVITTLPLNREVTLIDRSGKWMKIRIGGKKGMQGWLHVSVLKDSDNPK